MPHSHHPTIAHASRREDTVFLGNVTLADVLNNTAPHPLDLNSFETYAARRFVKENVDFWKDVSLYKNILLTPNDKLQQSATLIVETYINSNAPKEVNIPHGLREKTLSRVKEVVESSWLKVDLNRARCIFDECQGHVFNLLARDVFRPFLADTTTKERLTLARNNVLWYLPRNFKTLTAKEFFSFPNPINEAESRTNNLCTMAFSITSLVLDVTGVGYPISIVIWSYMVFGFLSRTLCGARLDLLPILVLFVLAPLLSERLHILKIEFKPGPPKRFAQSIGFIISTIILTSRLTGHQLVAWILCCILIVCSCLAFCGFCIACDIFIFAARKGWISSDDSLKSYVYLQQDEERAMAKARAASPQQNSRKGETVVDAKAKEGKAATISTPKEGCPKDDKGDTEYIMQLSRIDIV